MNISSVLSSGRRDCSMISGQTAPSRSFAETLRSSLSASSTSDAGRGAKTASVPGSLDEWLQAKISSGSIPKTIEDAGKKADQLSRYLSDMYNGAFKEAGISGGHGLSASYADGKFSVAGRLIQMFPSRPITGIGMGNSAVTNGDEEVCADSESEPMDFDDYSKMMEKMIDKCLEEFLDSDQSDTLGEFSFNKAISELAKFKPAFKEAFDKEPSTALDKYRDDILYYMENALFPVKVAVL